METSIHYIEDRSHPIEPELILRIRNIIESTCALVERNIVIPHVNFLIIPDKNRVIQELGISGACYSSHIVEVYIDPTIDDLAEKCEDHLAGTICHELNHAQRHSTVGYGTTLFEAIITEGLACTYERALFPKIPTPYTISNPDELKKIALALPKENSAEYDHSLWFFKGNKKIPVWAGYKIGNYVVESMLVRLGKKPEDLINSPFNIFQPGMMEVFEELRSI